MNTQTLWLERLFYYLDVNSCCYRFSLYSCRGLHFNARQLLEYESVDESWEFVEGYLHRVNTHKQIRSKKTTTNASNLGEL